MLAGLDMVAPYLISGRTVMEHNPNLIKVLERVKDRVLRLKLEKCKFCISNEINYVLNT